MKKVLRIVSGIENMSQKDRNKLYLNVHFKAYEDSLSKSSDKQKSYRG